MKYYYTTKAGPFYIVKQGEYYVVVFDDESLGSYSTPQQALDDLCSGHTF